MSTFALYDVRNNQSGTLEYQGTLADCVTQAAAISLTKTWASLAIVPAGYGGESNRPLLTYEQLQALAANVRRQPVLQSWT